MAVGVRGRRHRGVHDGPDPLDSGTGTTFLIDRAVGALPEGRRLVLSSDFFTVYQSLARVQGVDPLWCWAQYAEPGIMRNCLVKAVVFPLDFCTFGVSSAGWGGQGLWRGCPPSHGALC